MHKIKSRKISLISGVIIFAIVLRAVYIVLLAKNIGMRQFSDSLYMYQLATSLSVGDGFTINGNWIFNQSIGYPAFLAAFYSLFGSSVGIALAINCILGGISAGLVSLLVFVLVESKELITKNKIFVIATFAGLVAAIYPDSLLYCGLISSENLLIPLLLGLVLINGLKNREEKESLQRAIAIGVGTGVLAAVAATVKANVIIYCLFLGGAWVVSRQRWVIRATSATIVGVVLLMPVTIINYHASDGHIIPFAAVAGTVILDGTNPSATGKPTNLYNLECEKNGEYTEIELNRMRLNKAISYIKSDPAWYAKLVIRKIAYGFSPARDFVYEYDGKYRLFSPFVSRWYPTLFNGVLLLGILLGVVAGFKQKQRRLVLSSGCLLLAVTLLQAIFCAYSRYRFPFLFALIPLSIYGWMNMRSLMFEERSFKSDVGSQRSVIGGRKSERCLAESRR